MSAVDIRQRRLPDVLTIPLIGAGMGVTAILSPADLVSHMCASVAAYALFWAVAAGFRVLRGYDGLGMGDAKLMAAAGAWLGPFYLAPIVLVGSLLALAGLLVARASGRPLLRDTSVPFGPFLSVGFFAFWCLETVAPLSLVGGWW